MILYHGSASELETFNHDIFWLTDDISIALEYMKVGNTSKGYIYSFTVSKVNFLDLYKLNDSKVKKFLLELEENSSYYRYPNEVQYPEIEHTWVKQYAKKHGIDMMKVEDSTETRRHPSYAIFNVSILTLKNKKEYDL